MQLSSAQSAQLSDSSRSSGVRAVNSQWCYRCGVSASGSVHLHNQIYLSTTSFAPHPMTTPDDHSTVAVCAPRLGIRFEAGGLAQEAEGEEP